MKKFIQGGVELVSMHMNIMQKQTAVREVVFVTDSLHL